MKSPNPILASEFETVFWVRPEGRGTFRESAVVLKAIEGARENGGNHFVVDLEKCLGMDSTFMGMLAGLGIRFRKEGRGRLSVIGTTEKTRSSLEELGVQHVVDLEPSEVSWAGRLDEFRAGLKLLEGTGVEADQGHVLKCHEDLCEADPDNLPKFKTVLGMLGSQFTGVKDRKDA